MRKLFKAFAVGLLVLMQFQGIFSITQPQTASARDEQVILDNQSAKVAVTTDVTDDQIAWTLHYEKRAGEDDSITSLRFRIAEQEDGSGNVTYKDGDIKDRQTDDAWYREATYSASSEGTLTVTTAKTAKQLVVWVQLDNQLIGKTTTDTLTDTDAEAKIVEAPEIATAEEETVTSEEDATAESTTEEGTTETTTEEETSSQETVTEETVTPEVAAPVLKEKTDATTEEVQAAEGRLAYAAPALLARLGSSSANDQFKYTEDAEGKYPTDNTNAHRTFNGSTSNTDIRNYDYADTTLTTDDTKVSSIINSGTAFENGYTNYSGGSGVNEYNVYTKKSVKPTANENEYEVQLDVIGDAIRPLPKLDVVLVLDKSGSMTTVDSGSSQTRWRKLRDAVNKFATGLLDGEADVQIGMASFGGMQTSGSWGTYAEIASFGPINTGSNSSLDGYSTSASEITNHGIFSGTPTGGTPTFLGFDAGLNLLMNKNMGARDDATKIIITITDGVPTYYPTTGNNNSYTYENGNARTVQGSLNLSTRTVNNSSLRYTLPTTYWNGTGSANYGTENTAHVNRRYAASGYQNIDGYSIGFYTDANITTFLKALGPKGDFQVDDADTLVEKLHQIAGEYTAQIYNGILTDPMSSAVTRVGGVSQAALLLKGNTLTAIPSGSANYPQYASNINLSEADGKITLNNVTLGYSSGSQQGFRITYKVSLKEDYRDGLFHPTNETTLLKNGDGDYLHFAIPSVREVQAKGSLTVKKNWVDSNNQWNTREGITMDLYSRRGGSDWAKVDSKAFGVNDTSYTFDNLPVSVGSSKFEYKVIERTTDGDASYVPGYEAPAYAPETVTLDADATKTLTVTNTLKNADYEFTKTAGDGKTGLQGAKFAVTRQGTTGIVATVTSDSDGKVSLNNLLIGVYTVTETQAPDGYRGTGSFTVTVTDNGADKALTVTSTLTNDTLTNDLKNTALVIQKTDSVTGKAVEGATFEVFKVTEIGEESLGEKTTNEYGELIFTDGLPVGSYRVTETDAPDGYLLLEGDFTFTITETGKVTDFKYTGNDFEAGATPELELNEGTDLNQMIITAQNTPKPGTHLPSTGGMGTKSIIIAGLLLVGLASAMKLIDWRKKRGGDGNV